MIMFMPHASPVVKAYMTWHMGPTTCVSISRSLACFERLATGSDVEPGPHRLHLRLDPAENALACATLRRGRRTRG